MKARSSRMILLRNGPLIFAVFNAIPVQAFVNRAEFAQFVEDIFRGVVFKPGSSDPLGDFTDDPPIRLGFTHGRSGLAEALDPSFGIGLDAIRLAPGCGRENDIGQFGRFGHENVNDDEVVETLERVLAVIPVRIAHDGILPVNDHGVDPFPAGVESAHFRDAAFAVDFALVELGEFLCAGRVITGLESREIVGHGSAISGTLNVILAAHRIDTATLKTEIARHEGQVAK